MDPETHTKVGCVWTKHLLQPRDILMHFRQTLIRKTRHSLSMISTWLRKPSSRNVCLRLSRNTSQFKHHQRTNPQLNYKLTAVANSLDLEDPPSLGNSIK